MVIVGTTGCSTTQDGDQVRSWDSVVCLSGRPGQRDAIRREIVRRFSGTQEDENRKPIVVATSNLRWLLLDVFVLTGGCLAWLLLWLSLPELLFPMCRRAISTALIALSDRWKRAPVTAQEGSSHPPIYVLSCLQESTRNADGYSLTASDFDLTQIARPISIFEKGKVW